MRASPTDIDQIRLGQATMLRFTAFNQRTTPEVPGVVSRVAADLTKDAQRSGEASASLLATCRPGSRRARREDRV